MKKIFLLLFAILLYTVRVEAYYEDAAEDRDWNSNHSELSDSEDTGRNSSQAQHDAVTHQHDSSGVVSTTAIVDRQSDGMASRFSFVYLDTFDSPTASAAPHQRHPVRNDSLPELTYFDALSFEPSSSPENRWESKEDSATPEQGASHPILELFSETRTQPSPQQLENTAGEVSESLKIRASALHEKTTSVDYNDFFQDTFEAQLENKIKQINARSITSLFLLNSRGYWVDQYSLEHTKSALGFLQLRKENYESEEAQQDLLEAAYSHCCAAKAYEASKEETRQEKETEAAECYSYSAFYYREAGYELLSIAFIDSNNRVPMKRELGDLYFLLAREIQKDQPSNHAISRYQALIRAGQEKLLEPKTSVISAVPAQRTQKESAPRRQNRERQDVPPTRTWYSVFEECNISCVIQ